jgi:hypothetical protein
VILGRRASSGQPKRGTILYRRTRESGITNFKRAYEATQNHVVQQSRFSGANAWNFIIPELEEVWAYCANLPRFGEIADIGQGFSFLSSTDPALPKDAITESIIKCNGLVEGFARLRKSLQTHQQPDLSWLNLDPAVIARPRHGTTTGNPQVLLNYARVSRRPWRLKAFLDREGYPVTSRFLIVRSNNDRWPIEALWGVCNSPIANAYSFAFSNKRDVLAGLMRSMPVPENGTSSLTPLIDAVYAYLQACSLENDVLTSSTASDRLRTLHWRIDAEVLSLYQLPPGLERQVLDLFSGEKRLGVPFNQTEYLSKDFSEPLSLNEQLAITADWESTNAQRTRLIYKKIRKTILPAERQELADLQRLTDVRMRLLAPLPIKELEAMQEELKRREMWAED